MESKTKLRAEIDYLRDQLMIVLDVKKEVWKYHPSNPDFVNPIKAYKELDVDFRLIEDEVEKLELKLNSLN